MASDLSGCSTLIGWVEVDIVQGADQMGSTRSVATRSSIYEVLNSHTASGRSRSGPKKRALNAADETSVLRPLDHLIFAAQNNLGRLGFKVTSDLLLNIARF